MFIVENHIIDDKTNNKNIIGIEDDNVDLIILKRVQCNLSMGKLYLNSMFPCYNVLQKV